MLDIFVDPGLEDTDHRVDTDSPPPAETRNITMEARASIKIANTRRMMLIY